VVNIQKANANIQSDATEQRYLSNETKYESRRTVDVTNNRTRWEKHLNDVRLEDRLIDIEKWRNELERVLRPGFASDIMVTARDRSIKIPKQ